MNRALVFATASVAGLVLSASTVDGLTRPRARLALRRRHGNVAGHPRCKRGSEPRRPMRRRKPSSTRSGASPRSSAATTRRVNSAGGCAGGADRHVASPELLDVLAAFDEWRERDIGRARSGSRDDLPGLATRAAAEDRLPGAAELQAAVHQVRQRHWIDRPRPRSTATRTSDVPLRAQLLHQELHRRPGGPARARGRTASAAS